ncbi:MAG: XAC2610-related protein [Bacteroidota bacterium]
MKKLFSLVLLISLTSTYSQNPDWELFSEEDIHTLEVNKSGIYKLGNIALDVVWDDKLSYSENIGYYGGIKSLKIFKENQRIQELKNLEDHIALGSFNFNFYDYNLDGYLDFTIPINSRWKAYYIFNPHIGKFEPREDWDYLRIQKIDKKAKLILSQPDGMEDNRKIYRIEGLKLIEQ